MQVTFGQGKRPVAAVSQSNKQFFVRLGTDTLHARNSRGSTLLGYVCETDVLILTIRTTITTAVVELQYANVG